MEGLDCGSDAGTCVIPPDVCAAFNSRQCHRAAPPCHIRPASNHRHHEERKHHLKRYGEEEETLYVDDVIQAGMCRSFIGSLVRGMRKEYVCNPSQHASTSIVPLGWSVAAIRVANLFSISLSE